MARMKLFVPAMMMSLWSLGQCIQMQPLSPMEMMHEAAMDQLGNYILKWNPSEGEIIFEVHVATKGYVGLGFSTNGAMRGSDIIIAGVDDETQEIYLTDRYATGNRVPEIDIINNVQLLGGYQNETHTILRFSRPWNTCDNEEDLELFRDATVRLIWAYGSSDPAGGNPMAINYHTQRGSKSIYLNEPRLEIPEMGDDVKTWDVRSPNVELPGDLTTLYWCKLFKVPPMPRKTHVIGHLPLLSEDNIQHVHHILLYECHIPESENIYEKWVDVDGAQCFSANMPLSWNYCSSPLIAWAIGSAGNFVPEHAGFPLGEEHGGATYFMMEMHYDNPNLAQGVVDNSGLRIFYTENLRPNDAGILMIGHDTGPFQIIPPGQKWMSIGHCGSDCTGKEIPRDGINVFASVLHSHTLGMNMSLKHIRDNKELPVVIEDINYDFNYQEIRNLKEEVKFLQGDHLIAECGLDSTKRTVPTFGGFGTEEEMCLAFMYYYPRIDLAFCSSSPSLQTLSRAFGIQQIYPLQSPIERTTNANGIDEEAETRQAELIKAGSEELALTKLDFVQLLRGVVIKSPSVYENVSLYEVVQSEDTWKDEKLVERLQDLVIYGDHKQRCHLKSDSRTDKEKERVTVSYPDFTHLLPMKNMDCINQNENEAQKAEDPGFGVWNPLPCPPQLPNCNQHRVTNSFLGNRPTFF